MTLCIICARSRTSAPDKMCEACFLDRVHRLRQLRSQRQAYEPEPHHSCDPIAALMQREQSSP